MKTIRNFTKNPLTIAVLLLAFLNLSCNQDDFVENQAQSNSSDNLFAKSNTDYSGEEIFKGVFFFQGEIPKNIDAFQDILINMNNRQDSKEIEKELNSLADEIITYINDNDPVYFDKLKEVIKSNDYFSVQEYMNYTGVLIEQAIILNEKYGGQYLGYKQLFESEKFANELENIDFTNPESEQAYKNLLKKYGVTPPDSTNAEECTVAAGVCVAYAVAVAASIAVAAASAAGYVQVVVKTKYWFWDAGTDPYGKTDSNDLINQQIIAQLCNYIKQ